MHCSSERSAALLAGWRPTVLECLLCPQIDRSAIMDRDKLMKMAGAVRTGGKGTMRRWVMQRCGLYCGPGPLKPGS